MVPGDAGGHALRQATADTFCRKIAASATRLPLLSSSDDPGMPAAAHATASYPARPFRRADTARNNPDAVIPLLAARFWIAPGKPRPIPANATPRVPPAAPGCFSE